MGEVGGRIAWLVFVVFLAMSLGPKDFGLYNFAFAFTLPFATISDFGIPHLLTREISRQKEKALEYLSAGLLLIFLFSLIDLSIIMTAISFFESDPQTIYAVSIAAVALIICSFITLLNSIYRAHQKMEYEALVMFVSRTSIVIIGFFLIYLKGSLIEFIVATLLGYWVALILSSYLIKVRFVPLGLRIKGSFISTILRQTATLGIALTLLVACRQVNTVFLHFLRGDEEVGIYTAAYRLVEGLYFLSSFFIYALFPVFSECYLSSREKTKTCYEKSFKFILIFGRPVGVGVTLMAEEIVSLFGTKFLESASVLKVLIWMFVLTALNGVSFYLLVAANRQKVNAGIGGIALILNVLLNLSLVPRWGSLGSAWAVVATEGLWVILGCLYVSQILHQMPWMDMVLKPILGNIVMGGFIFFFSDLNLFLVIPIAMVVYASVLKLLKSFSEEETSALKEITRQYCEALFKARRSLL